MWGPGRVWTNAAGYSFAAIYRENSSKPGWLHLGKLETNAPTE